jgi:hypothetical protein
MNQGLRPRTGLRVLALTFLGLATVVTLACVTATARRGEDTRVLPAVSHHLEEIHEALAGGAISRAACA